jgi:fatty acid desaturase
MMRFESLLFTVRRMSGAHRVVELLLLAGHLAVWLALIVLAGPHWIALFLLTQLFGSLYFAAAVAPNHKGMPVWASGRRLPFLDQQVLSSRNVSSHPVWDYLYGGLNYQIEHHLFPTMARANLSRARAIVKPFCHARGLPYEEVNPVTSYGIVFRELHAIGQWAGQPPESSTAPRAQEG